MRSNANADYRAASLTITEYGYRVGTLKSDDLIHFTEGGVRMKKEV